MKREKRNGKEKRRSRSRQNKKFILFGWYLKASKVQTHIIRLNR